MLARAIFAFVLPVVLFLVGCDQTEDGTATGASAPPSATEADSATGAATPALLPAPADFALGVEYMELGLAEIYAATGVQWAKTRLEAFAWGQVERSPPGSGENRYDWSLTDALITEYQQAGIRNIQSYLSAASDWGSRSDTDVMPQDEFLDDYGDWVGALIERYDGDGIDDMPGLLAPVEHWVIGGEWTGFWGSRDAEDYLRMLEVASARAREAFPEVVIGTIPFLLFDVFHGNEPSAAQIDQRLEDPPRCCRNFTAGMLSILDRPELFDVVSVHSLGDYTEIPPTLRWFRERMAERGYQRPVFFDDAFPISLLANIQLIRGTGWPSAYPVDDESRPTILELLRSAARADRADSDAAIAWLRAETAIGTVRKAVTAYAEGAAGIQIGNLEDWTVDRGAGLREAQVNIIGAAALMGMIEVRHPRGYQVDDQRAVGEPRPAYHTFALLMQKIGRFDFDRVERIGSLRGARGYRLERAGQPIWVLWNEAGLTLPGEPTPTAELVLEVPEGFERFVVTEAITVVGETAPSIESRPVEGATITLTLSPVPVFVELER